MLAIFTCAKDVHAKVVSFCLAQEGMPHLYLHTDLLTRNRIGFRVGPDRPAGTSIHASCQSFHDTECSAVWYRRHVYPTRQGGVPVTEEARVIREQSAVFSHSLVSAFCHKATWFNAPEGETRAASKMAQLEVAQALGMNVPDTLIGNDPEAIREFVAGGSTVFKSFTPVAFEEEGTNFGLPTTRIGLGDLPDPDELQVLPGIYQRRVDKVSDIRLFIVGDEHRAIEMPLSANPTGRDDIRTSFPYRIQGHSIDLPAGLLNQCRNLMRTLGIRTGSFDFVRDGQGILHFLEVNPSGQFLWMEKVDPGCGVLGKFLNAVTASTAFDRYSFRSVLESPQWQDYRVDLDGQF